MEENQIITIEEPIPDDVIVAKNGAWISKTTKRFVKGSHPTNAPTKETAGDIARVRWKRLAEAAEDGVRRGTKRDSTEAAWSYVVEVQTERAIDRKDGKSTEAARFVQDALMLKDGMKAGAPAEDGAFFGLYASKETLLEMLTALRRRRGE